MSYLIKDTTEEERRRIGEMELRDINMAYSARYVKGAMDREPRSSCQMN